MGKAKCKNCTDEMIEEMAKEIFNTCAWRFGKPNDYKEICKDIAEDLIKLNYRKIPEGSVVLDKREHQKYCAYKIIEPQIKGCLDRERELEKQMKELEEQRDRQAYIAEDLIQEKHRWFEQARKEIFNELFKKYNMFNDNDVIIAWQVKEMLKKLAKKHGVEVEE